MSRILMAVTGLMLMLLAGCCYTPAGYDPCTGQPYGCCISPCCCGPLDPFCLSCGSCGSDCDDDDGCSLLRGLRRCICGPRCSRGYQPMCPPACPQPLCPTPGCGDCGCLPAPMVPGTVMPGPAFPAPISPGCGCGTPGYGAPVPTFGSADVGGIPTAHVDQSFLPPTSPGGPPLGTAMHNGTVYYEPSSSYYAEQPAQYDAVPAKAPPAAPQPAPPEPPQAAPAERPMPMSAIKDARGHRWIPVRF